MGQARMSLLKYFKPFQVKRAQHTLKTVYLMVRNVAIMETSACNKSKKLCVYNWKATILVKNFPHQNH